jgi:hypothetical protein
LIPQLLERFVVHVVRLEALERVDVRLPCDDECIPARSERGGDDFRDPHSRLRSEQCRQCLVLDLVQPPDSNAPRRIAVGKRAPTAGEPLSVLRIATEHAHTQWSSAGVATDVLRGTHPLLERRPQFRYRDAEGRERDPDLVRRRDACGSSECETRERGGAETEGQGAEGRRRERGAEDDGAERRERNEPDREQPHGSHELRADHGQNRGCARESQFRIPPLRQDVQLEWKPIGDDDASEDHSRCQQHQRRDKDVTREIPAPSQQHVHDDDDGEDERADEDGPPETACPAEDGRQGSCDLFVLLGSRRGDRGGQPDDERCDSEEDRVDRPAIAAAGLRLRQQAGGPHAIGRLVLRFPTDPRRCHMRRLLGEEWHELGPNEEIVHLVIGGSCLEPRGCVEHPRQDRHIADGVEEDVLVSEDPVHRDVDVRLVA